MQSSGGIPGVKVILASTAIAAKPLNVKMDDVSTFSNIEYGEGYLKVWKAYGIGPGKKLQLRKLSELDQESAIVDLSTACLKKDAAVQSDAHFIPLKKSVRSCKQSAPRKTTQEEAIEESLTTFFPFLKKAASRRISATWPCNTTSTVVNMNASLNMRHCVTALPMVTQIDSRD